MTPTAALVRGRSPNGLGLRPRTLSVGVADVHHEEPVVVVAADFVRGALAEVEAGADLPEALRLPAQAETPGAQGLVAHRGAGNDERRVGLVHTVLVEEAGPEHQLVGDGPGRADAGA